MNVLVGENAVGKSAIVDAIRQILLEDEFGRTGIVDSDFHKPFKKDAKPSDMIQIQANFGGLTHEESVAFLPWTESSNEASLNLHIENKQNKKGRYRRLIWGGASRTSIFEWELFEKINCIYLPPLRDSEAKLKEGRNSRLSRLLGNIERKELAKAREENRPHDLEKDVQSFYKELSKKSDREIFRTNVLIKERLLEALGKSFSQDTVIQFSEASFNRIVENLRLLFFPNIGKVKPEDTELFRNLEENSLGYNNLLYIATVLAELISDPSKEDFLKILLIEEPEAHLHPQLQVRLLKYLESVATDSNIQVIVTTHSPVISSSVSLDTIIHLSSKPDKSTESIQLKQCGLSDRSKSFISRWLDATKSILFFAKGVILVEGIAEALLLPELAKRVLKEYNKLIQNKNDKLPDTLEDLGVSIINMNGIYFKHFIQLFCNLTDEKCLSIPIQCAGITDNDPEKNSKPTKSSPADGKNHALKLIRKINISKNCRLFSNLKTFEYDLGLENGNLNEMLKVAEEIQETKGEIKQKFRQYRELHWKNEGNDRKKEVSFYLLNHIDKGEFAHALADRLSNDDIPFSVPDYIKKAVLWVCGAIE